MTIKFAFGVPAIQLNGIISTYQTYFSCSKAEIDSITVSFYEAQPKNPTSNNS